MGGRDGKLRILVDRIPVSILARCRLSHGSRMHLLRRTQVSRLMLPRVVHLGIMSLGTQMTIKTLLITTLRLNGACLYNIKNKIALTRETLRRGITVNGSGRRGRYYLYLGVYNRFR